MNNEIMSQTEEHPILFQTEMIKALLAGRKTQTRRVIKPQPADTKAEGKPVRKVADYFTGVPEHGQAYYWRENGCWNSSEPIKCPYGQPGDELWVRETSLVWENAGQKRYWFHGYDSPVFKTDKDWDANYRDYRRMKNHNYSSKWKMVPSIFMERRASRIQLLNIHIDIHRLQDITEEEAIAEGIKEEKGQYLTKVWKDGTQDFGKNPIFAFMMLWNSINAEPKPVKNDGKIQHYVSYPWEDIQETRERNGRPHYIRGNPWVWSVSLEIKKVKSTEPK